MYVNIVSFVIKPHSESTFVEMQKFEENTDAKPSGLIRYHIFKDRNAKDKYWLLEYWESKEDKDKLEMTELHKKFHELRAPVLEEKPEFFECDVVV